MINKLNTIDYEIHSDGLLNNFPIPIIIQVVTFGQQLFSKQFKSKHFFFQSLNLNMTQFGRLIIVTFKIVISVYMVYKTFFIEDRTESSSLLNNWCTIGFFALVEYITDKYGHVFYVI